MLKHVMKTKCAAGKNSVKSGTCKQDLKGKSLHCLSFRVNGHYTAEGADIRTAVSFRPFKVHSQATFVFAFFFDLFSS